jgi:hypothetical protein
MSRGILRVALDAISAPTEQQRTQLGIDIENNVFALQKHIERMSVAPFTIEMWYRWRRTVETGVPEPDFADAGLDHYDRLLKRGEAMLVAGHADATFAWQGGVYSFRMSVEALRGVIASAEPCRLAKP